MFSNFRLSMTWVHTWFGLVLGFVLMVCFFFGSLSVFDREIDRWAIPETRFEAQPMPSFDKVLLPALQQLEPDEVDYANNMPRLHDPAKGEMTPRTELPVDEYWAYVTHRDPVLAAGVGYGVPLAKNPEDHNHIHKNVTLDPRTGEVLPDDKLKIGSHWFYPMHYSLQLKWKNLGIWIVGLAALMMLAALVTGVIIHRKVFREFFTFRPWKRTQRASLDLHNLTGVVALPFHFFFAFTGLVIFASFYFLPVTSTLLDPLHKQHEIHEAAATGLPHEAAGVPGTMSSVDAMVEEAKRRWAARDMAGEVGFLVMHHVGDANSYVSIYRAGSDRVALVGEGIHFKTSTGEVLSEDPPRTPVSEVNEFLTGLHLQHFEHWFLRWLYVLGGLLGAVCIATGFIFFVEKRKSQHAKSGSNGSRVVDSLAVTTVTGMVMAAVGMLVMNRILPADMLGKADWEKAAFWTVWGLSFVHAYIRSAPVALGLFNPAWREQCWGVVVLSISAVLLNWATTGDHLIKTMFTDTYWPVAGVDLSLMACALVSGWAALKLARRERGADVPVGKTEKQSGSDTGEVAHA
ncbi:PepSY-associated TM helix domain-containing protein [Limnobacter sp.]|uniref:PepSY-associated TM helix domain-containing protein n=1 Tax=Limnobacter sp. TaxID=2003368 RepID=UPI00311ECF50